MTPDILKVDNCLRSRKGGCIRKPDIETLAGQYNNLMGTDLSATEVILNLAKANGSDPKIKKLRRQYRTQRDSSCENCILRTENITRQKRNG